MACIVFLLCVHVSECQFREDGDAFIGFNDSFECLYAAGCKVELLSGIVFLFEFTQVDDLGSQAMTFLQEPKPVDINILSEQVFFLQQFFF